MFQALLQYFRDLPRRKRRFSAGARRQKPRLSVKPLEERWVPATFNVNSTADIVSPPAGVVTLRSAIAAANATPGGNTINLTVPGTYLNTLGSAFSILPSGDNLNIDNTSGGAVTV